MMTVPFDPNVNDGRQCLGGPPSGVERARWKYLRGELSLKQFEESCAIWLRWEAEVTPVESPTAESNRATNLRRVQSGYTGSGLGANPNRSGEGA